MNWKVFTHDRRSPIQGGSPVWDGSLPFELPKVRVDHSVTECGAGWNYCPKLATALRIGGLWPLGRPSIVLAVEPIGKAVNRGDKSRAGSLRLLRAASEQEIAEGVAALSVAFGEHAEAMAAEQLAWRRALARPTLAEALIHAGLTAELGARSLDRKVRRFSTAQAAWDAWAAWAARDARDAWAAWDAWDAWDALTIGYAARQGWMAAPPDGLYRGVRDAYAAGLELAIPTGPKELGWAPVAEGR